MAIAAILGMAVPTTVLGAASYSDELNGAYDYAYGIGITTQSSIDTADMYGSLKRSHMAKMMSNYATEVLGKAPDTSKTCSFTDVSNETEEMQGYITKACQLGLMGVGIAAFNPNGLVTRAQFGTVLSRALYGDVNNQTEPNYYGAHLDALKAAGVMNNIDTPNANEVRGYVMLMMQRADEGSATPEICTTPENVLSCSLGLDTCPTVCQAAQETKSGTLSVSAVGATYTSIPNTGAVKFATVTFTAGSTDVNVYGVTLEKQALSVVPGTTKVYFEKDGARISSKATFSQNKATISFSTALAVKAGSSETVDLYVLLAGSSVGNEYQFASTYVDSSAATVDGTIVTPLMRTLSYDIANVWMANVSDTTSYKVDSTKLVELGQFSMYKTWTTASWQDKDVSFKAITLNQSENASLEYLTDLAIYRDDVKVSTKTTVDGRNVSFVLNDLIKATGPSTTYYVVKGKIANAERVGDKYAFTVRYPENTLVEENGTMFKAGIITAATTLPLSTMTINGADVKFVQPAMSYTKDVVPGTLAVEFYNGTVTAIDPVTLQNPSLSFEGTIGMTGDSVLRTIYMKIGSTVLSANPTTTTGGTVTFDGSVTINGTQPISVYADIRDTAVAGTVKFTNTINLNNGTGTFAGPNEYNTNGQAITSAIGSLSPITVNVVGASLSMTNTFTNAQNVQKGDRDIELAALKFSTTTDVISKVSSFLAEVTGLNIANLQGGTVTVYDAAGTALVSDTISTSTTKLHFTLPSTVNVSKTAPVTFTLKVDQIANSASGGDTLKLLFATGDVVAKNFITTNPIYPTAAAIGSMLTVLTNGSVSTIAQSFTPRLVQLDGSTVSLGTLKFKPFNGNAIVKNIYLRLSGYNAGEVPYSLVVLKDSGTVVAEFVSDDVNHILSVTNMNKQLSVDVTKVYDVVATLKDATSSGQLGSTFKFILTTGQFESMNGMAITASPLGGIVSSVVELVKAKPTISYVSSQAGGNATYKFSITANGGDIKLETLMLDIANNTAAATATGKLYLGNEWATQLWLDVTITSGSNLNKTFTALSGLVNITKNTTQEFTLVFPVSTWYVGGNPGNIGIEVSNISYYDVFANGSEKVHTNMMSAWFYKWDIAPVSTLFTLHQ